MAASEARKDFAETLNRVAYRGERVVLYRRGKPVAAVVPVADLRLLEEAETRKDLEDARAAVAEAEEKGWISFDEVKKELGI
jgi:prevent-host-death family protein